MYAFGGVRLNILQQSFVKQWMFVESGHDNLVGISSFMFECIATRYQGGTGHIRSASLE